MLMIAGDPFVVQRLGEQVTLRLSLLLLQALLALQLALLLVLEATRWTGLAPAGTDTGDGGCRVSMNLHPLADHQSPSLRRWSPILRCPIRW